MKMFLSRNEMIILIKSRNIIFNDEFSEMNFIEKHSYNMVINPYKIFHCSSYDFYKRHIYFESINVSKYIEFYKKQEEIDLNIFSAVKEFEITYSTKLSEIIFKDMNKILLYILDMQSKIETLNKSEFSENLSKELSSLDLKINQYYIIKSIGILMKNKNCDFESLLDCFSTFHGSKDLDLGVKIKIFQILPPKSRNEIFTSLQKKYSYKKIKSINHLNSI